MTEYKEIERKVVIMVNKYDPDDLITGGAPEDEYLSQVHGIISILSNNKKTDEWRSLIHKLFSYR